jgi:hypothetical protein
VNECLERRSAVTTVHVEDYLSRWPEAEEDPPLDRPLTYGPADWARHGSPVAYTLSRPIAISHCAAIKCNGLGRASRHGSNSHVLSDSYVLQLRRSPLGITLGKLASHGGVAQW